MKKRDCVILDIIATGIQPNKDKIIEIGAIKIKNCEKVETFESLVFYDGIISERITDLTKITSEMLNNAPKQQQVIAKFQNFSENLPLVIFDQQKIVAKLIEKAFADSIEKEMQNEVIDVYSLFKKELPLLKKYTLEELNKHYGINVTQTHKSIEDCQLIYSCLEHYAQLYLKRNFWNKENI